MSTLHLYSQAIKLLVGGGNYREQKANSVLCQDACIVASPWGCICSGYVSVCRQTGVVTVLSTRQPSLGPGHVDICIIIIRQTQSQHLE